MGSIIYSKGSKGSKIGRWSGKSYRNDKGKPRKADQMYLGKLIDEEQLIFFKKGMGYYIFNPEDQSTRPVTMENVSVIHASPEKGDHAADPIVLFGGPHFLRCLMKGIGYNAVLERLSAANQDSLNALLDFTLLSDEPESLAPQWLRSSVSKYYYPHADLESQRIQELLASLADPRSVEEFFRAHIGFVKGVTENENCIILCREYSNGSARVSGHEGKVKAGFQLVTVFHLQTGLPLYIEIVPENADNAAIETISEKMQRCGLKVTLVSGDAGTESPGKSEPCFFSEEDLRMGLKPDFPACEELLKTHLPDLLTSGREKAIRVQNHDLIALRTAVPIEKDSNAPVDGYMYLFGERMDPDNSHGHAEDNQMSSDQPEVQEVCEKSGVFAVFDTRDAQPEEIAGEVYVRQTFGKCFKRLEELTKRPGIHKQNDAVICGQVLLAFICGFIRTLIQNRMNVLDLNAVSVPQSLETETSGENMVVIEARENLEKKEVILEQTPYDRVFKSNPEALFYELNRIHAEVFEHPADGTRTLVPSVLYEEADEYYASFGINCPYKLLLTNMGGVLVPYLQPEKKDRICKALIFSTRPYAAAETILAAKRKKQEQAEEELRQKNAKLKESEEKQKQPKEKRKRGRPLGAKNKKTLEREAELARLAREGKLPEKRKRGRPLGSKNKKTLEREAAAEKEAAKTMKKRGRPLGSENKKVQSKSQESVQPEQMNGSVK